MAALVGDAGTWVLLFTWLGALVGGLALWRRSAQLQRGLMALRQELEEVHAQAWRLAESEQRFRSLVKAQPDIMVRYDADGRITFANAAYACLLGAPEAAAPIGAQAQPKVVETGPVRTRPDGVRLVDEAVETAEGIRWIAWMERTAQTRVAKSFACRRRRERSDCAGSR